MNWGQFRSGWRRLSAIFGHPSMPRTIADVVDSWRQTARDSARSASGALRDGADGRDGKDEGLIAPGRARMRPRPGEETRHHAGYLNGHLISWIADNRPSIWATAIDKDRIMMVAGYGASLATAQCQRAYPDPVDNRLEPVAGQRSVIKAHMTATLMTEKHRRKRIDAEIEQICFEWLLEQSEAQPTPALFAKMKQARERRLQRSLNSKRSDEHA